MIVVAVALPLLALALYLTYGSPRLPDQPLAARLQDPASEQNLEALVARVEARLREHPEEGEGWEVIAPVYLGWRRYGDAAEAYAQAIRLLGPSAKRLSGQGQALVLANDGVVTEEARKALEQALALDPTLIEPRILLAIAKEQDGQFAAAIEDWRALLGTSAERCAVARDGGEADRCRRSASCRHAARPIPVQSRQPSIAAIAAHDPGRASGDGRADGARSRRPARRKTATIFPAGSSWCGPIACSTGRTRRRRRCRAPRASSAATRKPSSSSIGSRPSLD